MTSSSEIPEPRHLRTWLGWVARERWNVLVRFVARCRHVSDPTAAPDIIHDAILKILAGEIELLNDHEKAWLQLRATIRNVARNRYRSDQVRRAAPLTKVPPSAEQVRDGRQRCWRICAGLEREEALEAALKRLTGNQREVVELRYLEGWTAAEVAKHRGCTADAVRKLEAGALATLAVELEARFGAE